MKIFVKTTALMLTAVLCLCLLFGCAAKQTDEPATTAQAVSDVTGQSAQVSEAASSSTGVAVSPVDFIGITPAAAEKLCPTAGSHNPCADGGTLLEFANPLSGISCSTHAANDDESATIRTVYIPLADAKITPALSTGGSYEDYKSELPELTRLEYNESVFSYSCTLQSKCGEIPVTVWLFFDTPEALCDGAVVTAESFAQPSGEAPVVADDFVLNYIGKKTSLAIERYGEAVTMDSENYSDEMRAVLNFGSSESEAAVKADEKSIVKAVSTSRDGITLLPKLSSGASYDEMMQGGFEFFGPKFVSEESGEEMCAATFRVGAANIESFVYFDGSGSITHTLFICKPLIIR